MGNTTDNIWGNPVKRKYRNSVLMAYSLNNHQPVQCTLISDQPFFYMDEEFALDEETSFDEDNYIDMFENMDLIEPGILEEELVKLKTKIDAYERVSLDFTKTEDERHQQFLMDCSFITGEPAQIDYEQRTQQIKTILNDSHYARQLLDFAASNNIHLVLSLQVTTSSYDKKAGKILVRADLDLADQVLLSIQELRRHWQHHQGALVHPLTFHPDHAVLINRAQMADLSVALVRVAWDLKLSGHKEIWARVENSSLSDLGRALAREALSDFRTLNNGKAGSAVFETWFLSERCRVQDKKLIQSMLADYRGYVFDSSEASHLVSIDLITALGEQPLGKNYLAAYAQMIMSDPIFTDVRDRSNANFLWFIKFEREFTETEQELQSSHLIKAADLNFPEDLSNHKNKIEDTFNENTYTDADREQLRQNIFGGQNARAGNNVVHVHFGKKTPPREGISS